MWVPKLCPDITYKVSLQTTVPALANPGGVKLSGVTATQYPLPIVWLQSAPVQTPWHSQR